MDRLTTDKPASEMGMVELAYNGCFAKDGEAYYRDYEGEKSARELARILLKKYADGDDSFTCDDDFDDEMIELLQYGTDTIEGLIALFYRNLWAMADLRETLKRYEDLEEQGLLLKLPCKIGDTVYSIRELCDLKGTKVVSEFTVCRFELRNLQQFVVDFDGHRLNIANFGKTIFLTKKEAEKVLADSKLNKNLGECKNGIYCE